MFRSLFIGFLILSTLASKSIEVQIIRNSADIPADILLDFIGAVVGRAGKLSEEISTVPGRAGNVSEEIGAGRAVKAAGFVSAETCSKVKPSDDVSAVTCCAGNPAGILPAMDGCRGNAAEDSGRSDMAFFNPGTADVHKIITCGKVSGTQVSLFDSDIYFCMSGLSPPQYGY